MVLSARTCAQALCLLGLSSAFTVLPRQNGISSLHQRIAPRRQQETSISATIPNFDAGISALQEVLNSQPILSDLRISDLAQEVGKSFHLSQAGDIGWDSLQNSILPFLATPWHAAAVVSFAIGNAIIFALSAPDDLSDAPYIP
eukprot:scaffold122214_cov28-Attheya_sp.AAC.1